MEIKLRGFSKKTINMYKLYNKQFLQFIKKNPKEITQDDVKLFLSEKLSNNLSAKTIGLIKAALFFYYNEILLNKFEIKTPKIKKKTPVVLSRDEIKKLFNVINNKKHLLLLKLYYACGLRLSEATKLRKSNLDFIENVIWIRDGKGGKDRMSILPQSLANDLKEYCQYKKSNDFIFTNKKGDPIGERNIQLVMQRAKQKAGIEKEAHIHTLMPISLQRKSIQQLVIKNLKKLNHHLNKNIFKKNLPVKCR